MRRIASSGVRSGLFAIIVLLLTAVPAMAARPTREPVPLPPSIELPAGFCEFPVVATFPVNRQYQTTFFDGNGDVTGWTVTGHLVVTLTNGITGESITANISGPWHVSVVRGTDVSVGRWGGPFLGTLSGISVFAGHIDNVSLDMRGHLVADVCAVLAP